MTPLRGHQNPEIKNATLCSEIATFATFHVAKPGRRQWHPPPQGPWKSMKFQCFFESFSNGLQEDIWTPKRPHKEPREPKKGPKGPFGMSPGRLLIPKLQYWYFARTMLFIHFQYKIKVWDNSDALWDASWNPLRAVNTLGFFFGLLCPARST